MLVEPHAEVEQVCAPWRPAESAYEKLVFVLLMATTLGLAV